MKKRDFVLIAAGMLCVSLAPMSAAEEKIDGIPVLEMTDIFAEQTMIDEALEGELAAGYPLEEALIVVNPYGTSPLSAVAIFSTEESVGGTVTVKGKTQENDITGPVEAATDHLVPIYGLYSGDTTEVIIQMDDGTEASFEVTADAVPVDYGTIETQMYNESLYDYNKMTFVCSTMGSMYALDAAGDIRYFTNSVGVLGVHRLKNGHLMMPAAYVLHPNYYKEGLVEVDLNGRIYREYAVPGGQHHDFYELENGNLLVASDSPDFSTVEDYVVELDRETGEVVWELDMKDLLSAEDGQSASMESDGSAEADWFHNNGIWYDAETDVVLLSARHKDAIAAVNRSDKTLAWILGDPTGWENVDQSLFFEPEGTDFEWFYSQHHVSMLDNGDIMLFDNGTAKVKRADNENRVTGDDVYSRAVVYHLDTEAMTVSQIQEYGKERGAEWYSDWISGVESLDGTKDHLWITAGSHLYNPEDERCDYYPSDMFLPGLIKMSHIDQVDMGELTYEITVSSEGADALTFRSFRMDMYNDTEGLNIEEQPELLGTLGVTRYTQELPEGADPAAAETLSEDMKAELRLDGIKLAVSGQYLSQAEPEEIKESDLILAGEDEIRVYPLKHTLAETEDGVNVTLNGWVSTSEITEKEWEIYLFIDEKLYLWGSMPKAE